MQKKGQISVEMIMVFVYFFVVITMVFTISENFVERQSEIHIRNQEIKIANSLSKIISSSKGFEEGDSYLVEYRVPMIYTLGKAVPMTCGIEIRQNTITVTDESGTVSAAVGTELDMGVPLDIKCGETLAIS